jgi:hypothetical protein
MKLPAGFFVHCLSGRELVGANADVIDLAFVNAGTLLASTVKGLNGTIWASAKHSS